MILRENILNKSHSNKDISLIDLFTFDPQAIKIASNKACKDSMSLNNRTDHSCIYSYLGDLNISLYQSLEANIDYFFKKKNITENTLNPNISMLHKAANKFMFSTYDENNNEISNQKPSVNCYKFNSYIDQGKGIVNYYIDNYIHGDASNINPMICISSNDQTNDAIFHHANKHGFKVGYMGHYSIYTDKQNSDIYKIITIAKAITYQSRCDIANVAYISNPDLYGVEPQSNLFDVYNKYFINITDRETINSIIQISKHFSIEINFECILQFTNIKFSNLYLSICAIIDTLSIYHEYDKSCNIIITKYQYALGIMNHPIYIADLIDNVNIYHQSFLHMDLESLYFLENEEENPMGFLINNILLNQNFSFYKSLNPVYMKYNSKETLKQISIQNPNIAASIIYSSESQLNKFNEFIDLCNIKNDDFERYQYDKYKSRQLQPSIVSIKSNIEHCAYLTCYAANMKNSKPFAYYLHEVLGEQVCKFSHDARRYNKLLERYAIYNAFGLDFDVKNEIQNYIFDIFLKNFIFISINSILEKIDMYLPKSNDSIKKMHYFKHFCIISNMLIHQDFLIADFYDKVVIFNFIKSSKYITKDPYYVASLANAMKIHFPNRSVYIYVCNDSGVEMIDFYGIAEVINILSNPEYVASDLKCITNAKSLSFSFHDEIYEVKPDGSYDSIIFGKIFNYHLV